jgi:meso-butanediol dehydrogenase/(S,S)-butanediol dehydrogenase/diacetyl reductase
MRAIKEGREMRFQDKGVVVTGGGSGIGRETALAFAAEGAKVVIADIDPETAEGCAAEIVEGGGQAKAFTLDTTDAPAMAAGFAAFEDWLGALDVLVNSAGVREIVPMIELSYEEWCRVIGVNLTGVFLCSQTFVRRLVEAGRAGAIVNLASTLGLVAAPKRAAYTASKHAVVGLTKQMALELGEQDIRINAVGPGVTRTAMTEAYFDDPEMAETVRSVHAMNRWGEADEIARAILFLASDEASFITGTTLMVDGGWTAGKKM